MSEFEEYEDFEEEEFTTKINRGTLRRLAGLARPYWLRVSGFLLMIAVVAGSESYLTFLIKRIVDEAILKSDVEALIALAIQYGIVSVLLAGAVFGFIWLAGSLSEIVQYDLRKRMFNHLQDLSFRYFDHTPVGWIMSRLTSDTSRIGDLLAWGVLDSSWFLMSTVSSMIFMMLINWQLALVVFAIVPLLLVVAAQFQKKILVEYRAVRRINSKITGAYNENISGVRVAKALVREEQNLEEFGQLTSEMYKSGYRAAWLSAIFLPIVQIIAAFAVGGIVWYGGWQVQIGALTIGGIQAFVTYVTFMLFPLQEVARVYAEMQRAIASAERIFSLLDTTPDIIDVPAAKSLPSLRADIRFENVDFFYEAGKPVLENFNLHIRSGETIALVGPTGGGKSTIVNLLSRALC